MIYYETDYLAHHGVKGMKWGRRKQRVLKGRQNKSSKASKSNKKWSTKKKVAIGAAIVGGTALAAIGGIAITKGIKTKKFNANMDRIRKQNEALKNLEEMGKRAMNNINISKYTYENEFGKVVAVKNSTGQLIDVVAKDGVKRLTW